MLPLNKQINPTPHLAQTPVHVPVLKVIGLGGGGGNAVDRMMELGMSGVDFISANENVHFSSVLVLHRASKTIHVDDTLMYVRLPKAARLLGTTDVMSFHPTLAKALEKRPGAAQDFRDWATDLAERWRDAQNLCAAHTATLMARKNKGASIHVRMLKALDKVSRTLKAHEGKYG